MVDSNPEYDANLMKKLYKDLIVDKKPPMQID